jgi:aldehyde dehydrogenase (NAD+)
VEEVIAHYPIEAEARRVFALQQVSRWRVGRSTAEERIAKLDRLRAAILEHRGELSDAMWGDFRKPPIEAQVTEIQPLLLDLAHVRARLADWMRPVRARTPWVLTRTRSEVRYEPRGVVLIMAPWNYPVGLVLTPLVAAVAAGNCAILRPSEKVPRTAAVLERIIRQAFDESEVACFTEAGTDLAAALLTLPFDHIFFTGSARVARRVLHAAADHLASVTLELGGKSPLIVDDTADVEQAARRAVWGKCVNAGQTCIAPDYAIVHEDAAAAFVDAAARTIAEFYGATEEARKASPDFARAVDAEAFVRLSALLEEAVRGGARVAAGGEVDPEQRYIAPTIVTNVSWESPLMREEIFGPILPVVTFRSIDDAINAINRHGHPLALYMFSRSQPNIDAVLDRTSSGGVAINTVMIHFANPHIPFGGIGESGQGSYHGWYGFRTFSHERSLLVQRRGGRLGLFDPPYGRRARWLLKLLDRVTR